MHGTPWPCSHPTRARCTALVSHLAVHREGARSARVEQHRVRPRDAHVDDRVGLDDPFVVAPETSLTNATATSRPSDVFRARSS